MKELLFCAFILFFFSMMLREWLDILKRFPIIWVSAICIGIAFIINSDAGTVIAKAAKTALAIGAGAVAVTFLVCVIAAFFDNDKKQ